MTNLNYINNSQDNISMSTVSISTDEIRNRLINQLEDVLRHLLPNGKLYHRQYHVGNIQGDSGESLKIELQGTKAGMWQDFATGEGGNIFDLWAKVRGIDAKGDFPKLMEEIQNWLSLYMPVKYIPAKNVPKHMEKKFVANDDLGNPSAKWDYTDKDGKIIATVFRYDPKGKSKQFRPYDDVKKIYKAPDIRPLYNQPGIIQSDKVILVEGEKCAQALIDQGICATTSMFGAKAPLEKTDWSPLNGKDVIIWPDNDDSGKGYAQAAYHFLLKQGVASVKIIEIPENKPDKWDAADSIAEGETTKIHKLSLIDIDDGGGYERSLC